MVVERALWEAWKIFQVFFKWTLKNKGIVIVVKQKKTIELVHYST